MAKVLIDQSKCVKCGQCIDACALICLVRETEDSVPGMRDGAEEHCIDCGHCMAICPSEAVSLDGVDGSQCEKAQALGETDFEQFARLVRSRRSIRKYQQAPIEQAKLDRLLDLVRWAPTARNVQPVEWIVVNSPEKVQELAAQVIEYLREQQMLPGVIRAWESGIDMIHRSAPCLAIATSRPDSFNSQADCTIAVETLDLAASAMGLGACWAGFFMMGAQAYEPIGKMIELPEQRRVEAALLLGEPAEQYLKIPPRKPSVVKWID